MNTATTTPDSAPLPDSTLLPDTMDAACEAIAALLDAGERASLRFLWLHDGGWTPLTGRMVRLGLAERIFGESKVSDAVTDPSDHVLVRVGGLGIAVGRFIDKQESRPGD